MSSCLCFLRPAFLHAASVSRSKPCHPRPFSQVALPNNLTRPPQPMTKKLVMCNQPLISFPAKAQPWFLCDIGKKCWISSCSACWPCQGLGSTQPFSGLGMLVAASLSSRGGFKSVPIGSDRSDSTAQQAVNNRERQPFPRSTLKIINAHGKQLLRLLDHRAAGDDHDAIAGLDGRIRAWHHDLVITQNGADDDTCRQARVLDGLTDQR